MRRRIAREQGHPQVSSGSPPSSHPYATPQPKPPVSGIPPGYPRSASPYAPPPSTPQYSVYAEDAHSITFVDPAGQLVTVPRASMSDPGAWQRTQAWPHPTPQVGSHIGKTLIMRNHAFHDAAPWLVPSQAVCVSG